MIQLNPEPPPDHYIQLGRLMSACSMLGMIGWAAKNGMHWCVSVGADPLDVKALQEWDYLHADEMTDAEHRTGHRMGRGLDLYSAA